MSAVTAFSERPFSPRVRSRQGITLMKHAACIIVTLIVFLRLHQAACTPDTTIKAASITGAQQEAEATATAAATAEAAPSGEAVTQAEGALNPVAGAVLGCGNGAFLPGAADQAAEAMLGWIRQNGGEVNVAVRRVPGAGRATFALQDFQPGDVFARIPVEMCYKLDAAVEFLPVSAAYLVLDLAMAKSPWQPYFRALPSPSEIRSVPNFPRTYLPLIQDSSVEGSILTTHEQLQHLWERNKGQYEAVLGPAASPSNLTYTMSLLLTRLFGFDKGVQMLVPLLDLANHQNGCTHSHHPGPCDPALDENNCQHWDLNARPPVLAKSAGSGRFGPEDSTQGDSSSRMSGQCVVWRATEYVAAGQEVCNAYKILAQDRALLQYGFLQDGPAALELSAVDRHDFNSKDPWFEPPGTLSKHGPPRFSGTPPQIKTELARLSARLRHLAVGEAAAAAINPDPKADADGRLLSLLKEWRQQRMAAIKLEISRLQRQAARLEAMSVQLSCSPDVETGTTANSEGGTAVTAAEGTVGEAQTSDCVHDATKKAEAFSHWLEDNGAEVNVQLQLRQHIAADTGGMTCSSSDSSAIAGRQDSCQAAPSGSSRNASDRLQFGVVTRKDIKMGEALAIIPVSLAYKIEADRGQLDSAVDLMLTIHKTLAANLTGNTGMGSSGSSAGTSGGSSSSAAGSSGVSTNDEFYEPFLAVLPRFGSMRSLYTYPQKYLAVLQHPAAEARIRTLQHALLNTWEKHRAKIEAVDSSLCFAELQHAMSIITALPTIPSVINSREQLLLLPLFTSARHNSSCEHSYSIAECPDSIQKADSTDKGASTKCFFWTAGSDLPAGTEVCTSYGQLRPDQALLQYGLNLEALYPLQSDREPDRGEVGQCSSDVQQGMQQCASAEATSSQPVLLSGMDTVDSTDYVPFGPVSFQQLVPAKHESRDVALKEAARLQKLHTQLTAASATNAVQQLRPAAADANGTLLQQLRQWREQRVLAIELEVDRLLHDWGISQAELAAAVAAPSIAQQHAVSSEDRSDTGPKLAISSRYKDGEVWSKLMQWLQKYGAVVNVDVADAGADRGRIVVANRTMRRGDLLAAIPVDICFTLQGLQTNTTWEMASVNLLAHMLDANSPWRPYLDALPAEDEIMCPLAIMPREYLHLLSSNRVEAYVQEYQGAMKSFWRQHAANFARDLPGITYEHFAYARSLLITRLFAMDDGSTALVPMLDLSNHVPNCPNIHTEGPCPGNPSRQCVLWQSGEYLAPGAEVCNSYKFMTNERSMLQYGFLQTGPIATQLNLLDYPDFGPELWSPSEKLWMGPQAFNGSCEDLQAEHTRLQGLLHTLTAADASAKATPPAVEDSNGRMLELLLAWRQQRQAAIKAEMARLTEQLAQCDGRLAKQGTTGANQKEELLRWIEQSGGKVSGLRLWPADSPTPPAAPAVGSQQGVWVTQPFAKGSVVAVVPLKLAVNVYKRDLLIDAPTLWSDLRHTRSPRKPYWTAVPPVSEVVAMYNIPLAYAPVIQHNPTESFMRDLRAAIADVFERHAKSYEDSSLTSNDVPHVLALVASRSLDFTEGSFLVPLLDTATHRNNCTNIIAIKDCQQLLPGRDTPEGPTSNKGSSKDAKAVPNETGWCVYLEAGTELVPGDEVCIQRGYMLPDKAMLQHGVLVTEGQTPLAAPESAVDESFSEVPLFGMDRHDFATLAQDHLPWMYPTPVPPIPFTGSPSEVAAETQRLQGLADELDAGEAAAAEVQPVASDRDGLLLHRLRQWRRLRRAAIAQELQRLQHQEHHQEQQQ